MRPDQHKKKRSSDYKKKHGVPSKQKSSTGARDQPDIPESGSSSSEEEVSKFKRKEIKTNWERYQELDDEKEDQGEDYAILLSRGGDASTHIQLAGEEEWDGQLKPLVFDVDYEKLADQLSKLPFIQRFSIDKLEINPDLLSYSSQQNNTEHFSDSAKTEVTFTKNLIGKAESSELGFSFTTNYGRNEATPLVTQQTIPEGGNKPLLPKQDLEIEEYKKCHENEIKKTKESEESPKIKSDDQSHDDRLLEELLQATNMVDKNDTVLNNISLHQQDKSASTLVQTDPSPNATEEVEDLEDWLDSIL